MLKNQKSVRDGIEDFLCPFTDMYISQGSNGKYSHSGIMANDVRGLQAGVRYPYYAPCKVKCIRTYSESGQVMWQSVNKVRFANGRVDYATFMTAHDDTMNAKVGMIVEQGSQLGNMGTKGNSTGVHCHIEVSQSNDSSWIKNRYGIYHFNHEYDLDDCYFVDNTNIIQGMGGNWRTTKNIKVGEKTLKIHEANQVLCVGSKVKFDGIFKVDILKKPLSSNLFGNSKLTGVKYLDYKKERAKSYHWIPLADWVEVDTFGSSFKQDQIVTAGVSYVLNKNTYSVVDVDSKTNSVKLNISGRDVWIFGAYLYEV